MATRSAYVYETVGCEISGRGEGGGAECTLDSRTRGPSATATKLSAGDR